MLFLVVVIFNCLILNVLAQDENVEIYLYNATKNKCLKTTGLPDTPLTYGSCDNSENTVWIIPASHNGNFRSKANPDYCLNIEDGIVSIKECNESTILYRDVNFIKSPLYDNYCVGSSESNSYEIALKECDVSDPDQIWYFNLWDPSIVIEDTPALPESVIVYFYNAYKNKCIHNDGTTVVVGNCFNTENSLFEIPTSHEGLYRSKVNPEKCLSVIDGVVSLSECNENDILYRDGNFIRSPLSENYCIAASKTDNSLEYIEGCDFTDPDHIWYYNIWTPPETEVAAPAEVAVETEVAAPAEVAVPTEVAVTTTEAVAPTEAAPAEIITSTEIIASTEIVEPTEVSDPTTEIVLETKIIVQSEIFTSTVTEEKPTMTVTTVVTSVISEVTEVN